MASTPSAENPNPSDTNEESNPRKIVLHVLCPTLPSPNRFTFHDFTLSSTVASLKTRLSESIPSRPTPAIQKLIYCGKPIANDGLTLQSVLEPVESTEYSIHLVLPPAPTPSTPTAFSTGSTTTTDFRHMPMQPNPLFESGRSSGSNEPQNSQDSGLNAPGLRFRGSVPPPGGVSEADIGLSLRRNIDTLRRHVEQQQRALSPQARAQEAATTFPNPLSSPTPSSQFPRRHPYHQRSPDAPSSPLHSVTGQSPLSSGPRAYTTPPSAPFSSRMPAESVQLSHLYRARVQIIQAQIALYEDQLRRGNAPPLEQIIRMRNQLFQFLDHQYQNPIGPRDNNLESLISRVLDMYTRADQIRVMQLRSHSVLYNNDNAPTTTGVSTAPLHLLTSPDGYQALIASQNESEIMRALSGLRPSPSPEAAPLGHGHPPPLQQNAEAAVLQNAVRQAVLNQQMGNAQNAQLGFARNMRRIWLFVRLYFFCYMFSQPGTWSRILLVCLAVVISLLSETGVPQYVYRITVAPVRRHFESLVQVGPVPPGAGAEGTQQRNEQGVAATVPRDQRDGSAGNFRNNIRRVERSVALFLASLIPGVGERHVEVRNAVEAAERAREEERRQEEQRREEANNTEGSAEQQPQESTNASAEAGQDATTGSDSQYDTPGDERS
ncbi:Conserved fungal protein [Aspergillus sclerotialis]|uniref:Conserved fungal protein n=1 Tax=Aspergillus sclerotialis TaxID=2070753 RepID=A0A3A2Z9S9_9EURO|nr:Conserved fungal protein [Aspergillus sclerotialis]